MSNVIYSKKLNKKYKAGVDIKYTTPNDFLTICSQLKTENTISVNLLRNHYNIKSPSIINRWLLESGLTIKKSNVKKEELINLQEFKVDCETGTFCIKELSLKYLLSVRKVKEICLRNSFNLTLIDIITKEKTPKRKKISNDIIDSIKLLSYNNETLSSISKKVSLNRSVIVRLCKENNIPIPIPKTVIWENDYQKITEDLEKYIELNKSKTLIDISLVEKISIEQLKKAFKENSVDVVLHSYNKSKGELEVRDFITSCGFECISTKKLFNGKRLEIDCFVPELNFGVEYCGEYYHQFDGTNKTYHLDKYNWCNEQGIELITIFEHEWYQKQEVLKSIIRNKLGLSTRIFGRKTVGKTISGSESKVFHEYNHINGYVNSSLNYGLFHNDILVSVLSLSKTRFDKKYKYEITRLSTLQNHCIVGGFSKLLKLTGIDSLMTYADLRFGSGNVYLNNGFQKCSSTPPNYWYFDRKDCEASFESRMKYQKKKLINMNGYDDDKTELEIMTENNYLRIYDCGSNKFALSV